MTDRKKIFVVLPLLFVCLCVILGCGKEEIPYEPENIYGNAIMLHPYNLPSMDGEVCYELWLVDVAYDTITNDADTSVARYVREEMSLGKFYWDKYRYEFYNLKGNKIENVFPTEEERNVYDFNTIMITIEPANDDEIRSNNGLIYDVMEHGQPIHGVFNFFGDASRLVAMELPDPGEGLTADFVLGTYSDDGNPRTRRASGIWFHSYVQGQTGMEFMETLRLPVLLESAGFTYEGWVKKPGEFPRAISTGKFKTPYSQDWANPYAGPYGYLNIPGEDFLRNPPTGFESLFPLNLMSDGTDTVFITIEPYPDPHPAEPFPLRLFDRGELPPDSASLGNTFHLKNMYHHLPSFDAEVLEL